MQETAKYWDMLLFYTCAIFLWQGKAFAQTNNAAPYEISCERRPDGLLEIGCWGFATCNNGTVDVHTCPVGTVLDRGSMTCLGPGEGQTDCHLATDCVGKVDGSYADLGDGCISYYRCFRGLNMGRFYCPAPTAFNEDYGICDYVNNLRPPCGFVGAVARTTTPVVSAVTLKPVLAVTALVEPAVAVPVEPTAATPVVPTVATEVVPAAVYPTVPAAANDVVPSAVSQAVPAEVTPVVPATASPVIPAVTSPFVPAKVPPVVPVVSSSVVLSGESSSTSTFAP
ncbi:unnamed protein product [Candidula unifasciata]|uniref:Chitin-binding type-2 domain-containing protein n=1 Tax=Candidula unifasciata TaxID=100452 RepID=A0A8S3Z5U2_9EUPU|nr:unnamed protein product [Candidula unifasciata]